MNNPLILFFRWATFILVSSCMKAEIFMMMSKSTICDDFHQFIESFWWTHGRIPSWRVATWPVSMKKHATSRTSHFRWIFIDLKDPHSRLALSFWFICINPRLVTCDDVVNIFGSTSSEFFSIWRHQSTRVFLWTSVNKCGVQRAHSLRTPKCSCKISCMLVAAMPRHAPISRYVTWRSTSISFRTASMFSGTTTDFGRPSCGGRLSTLADCV